MIISMENNQFDSCGSYRQGHIENATFEQLVASFGEPTFMDRSFDEKVTVEWHLTFEMENGSYVQATIYDYKTGIDFAENTRWSIGGFDELASTCVNSVLYLDRDFKKLVEGV